MGYGFFREVTHTRDDIYHSGWRSSHSKRKAEVVSG